MPNTLSPEFKAGDRVRYTGNKAPYWKKETVGHTGVVKNVYNADSVAVDWDVLEGRRNPAWAVYPENLELVVEPQAPIVLEGPFYVFAVPRGVVTYDTMDEAVSAAQRTAKSFGGKFGIFTGHKAFMIPKEVQEVSIAH